MVNVPANYKHCWTSTTCPLCEEEEGNTEHYVSCRNLSFLASVWEVNSTNETEPTNMVNMARFMDKVSTLLEPSGRTNIGITTLNEYSQIPNPTVQRK